MKICGRCGATVTLKHSANCPDAPKPPPKPTYPTGDLAKQKRPRN